VDGKDVNIKDHPDKQLKYKHMENGIKSLQRAFSKPGAAAEYVG
jgi:hypothetical protein